jgi:acyl carrier protein
MSISRNEVRALIIESIREVVENKDDVSIDDETDPIRELGLDSDDGVDFACAISEKLHYEVPDSINPFVSDKPTRSRRVREIVDLMCKLVEENGQRTV